MEWIRDHAWQAWLALSIILAVSELASMDLVLLMLAGGALAGMVAALIGLSGVVQVLVAAVCAIAFLALIRKPLVNRLHRSPSIPLGVDRLAGMQAVVTRRITTLEPGQIRLDNETWSATPGPGSTGFEVGQTVEVIEIRGATAVVK